MEDWIFEAQLLIGTRRRSGMKERRKEQLGEQYPEDRVIKPERRTHLNEGEVVDFGHREKSCWICFQEAPLVIF